MTKEKEPHDGHIYDWISFGNDTWHFFLKAVQFYESLLREDVEAIESQGDLAFLLNSTEANGFEIHQELQRVARVRKWIEDKVEKYGETAWGYTVSMSHGRVRFLKSVGLLYLQHLRNLRNKVASKPRISKYALKAIDNRISYFEEKLAIGVFKDTTPYPLAIETLGNEDKKGTEGAIEEKNVKRPRPVLIDTIEIRDPQLKKRCLDLFNAFQQDGQHDRLDTVVSEATRILEDKLRSISGAPPTRVGVDLATFAFGGETPRLVVSDVPAEQEAAHLLFRGVFGFIRNPVQHRLIKNLSPERVLQIVGMVDYLIFLAESSKGVREEVTSGGY